ncbi:PAS domain S-box protein [Ammoniphilus sp. CFH 90114]|uniref:PAS domain S-box protein n=1 Tax=Ammoniphilus sp. CFH 90114 TaxID=2493665 RepID=UPI00100E9B16|nr:PAS domain S-box protein [Ammoniphilus sp. CFH 90114]RXT06344.1 PAS domain S-box protein [Ammoniphilus sp. CFH 90114]
MYKTLFKKYFRIPVICFFLSVLILLAGYYIISTYESKNVILFVFITLAFLMTLNSVFLYRTLKRNDLTLVNQKKQWKEAEELVVKQEQKYRSIFENSTHAIMVTDINGRVLDINPSFTNMYGWTLDEIIGECLPMVPDIFIDTVLQDNQKVAEGERIINKETFGKTKDGRLIDISLSVSSIIDNEGKITIFSLARDITEKKMAVRQLEIMKSELQQTIRHQQGIIFKLRKKGNRFIYTMCDGRLLSRLGLSTEAVVDKEDKDFMSLERARTFTTYYERAWKGEEVFYEFSLRSGITCLTNLTPIIENGKTIELLGSSIDVTDKKRSEEMLMRSEKLSVVGKLAAGVAHEIRNPLTSIRGFLQYLKPSSQEDHQKFFDVMLDELDRIHDIVKEFLFLAKPHEYKFESVNLVAITQQVIKLLEPQFILNNVQVSLSYYQLDDMKVNGEPNQLKQVLINVLKNAAEAMEEKGGMIHIHITHWEDQYIMRIRDEGCGIPKERLKKIGEPFFTTKEKGTGLGMMVTHKIIEGHGGTIRIVSKEGEGTLVEIGLPEITPQNLFILK